jgi:hypothetical protein
MRARAPAATAAVNENTTSRGVMIDPAARASFQKRLARSERRIAGFLEILPMISFGLASRRFFIHALIACANDAATKLVD